MGAGKFVRAPQRGDPILQFRSHRPQFRILPCRHADQAVDDRKDVLDPVAQFPAEHLVFLGDHLGLMDIGAGSDPADDLALGIAQRERAAQGPAIFAAMVAQPVVHLIGFAGGQRMPPDAPRMVLVVGMEHTIPALAIGRSGGNAGELVPASIIIVVITIGQGRPHHLRHRVGEDAERRVHPLQRVAGIDDPVLAVVSAVGASNLEGVSEKVEFRHRSAF